MTTILSPMKQSLIILGIIIIVAGITFATLAISRDSSRNYLKSSPYYTLSDTLDNELRNASQSIISRLDAIVVKVKNKSVQIRTASGDTAANSFLDWYLTKVDTIDTSLQSDVSYSSYKYLFTYLYPRVYAIRNNLYIFTINKNGTGSGTITSSPSGMNCSSTSIACSSTFTIGSTVTLTATAAAGYTFAGWSGVCSGTGTCTINVSDIMSVNATFSQNPTGGAINGTCNSIFNSYTTPTPTCSSGTPTAISGTGPWTWGCNTTNNGTSTAANACSANKNVDCIGAWGACTNGSQTYTVTTTAQNGGVACGSTNGATQSCTTLINGTCDNTTQYACTTGTSSGNVAGSCGGSATWSCLGSGGGSSTTTCTKTNPACSVNGTCNSTFNSYTTPTPTCSSGTPTAIAGTGPWTWGCNSTNNGTNTAANECSANKTVDCVGAWGACTNGSKTYSITTTAQFGGQACVSTNGATQSCGTPAACNNATQFACTSGTSVSNVAGSCGGSATWGCNSTDGGTSTTATACYKTNDACAVNGACNNATQFACTSGTSSSNVAGSCGGSSTWSCLGSAGGSHDTTCTKTNPACSVNGTCNSTFNSYTIPTPTCSSGTPTAITGTGPWTWGCNSTNNGTNTAANACSANKTVDCVGAWGACTNGSKTYSITTTAQFGGQLCVSTNGATQSCGTPAACNNNTQFACTSGTSVSNVAGSCGGSATWGCNSSDGGANTTATACTKANAECTKTFTCSAKPTTGTIWNSVPSYTQTQNGSTWSPADSTTTYNTTASTTACRYKCDTNYAWKSSTSTCVSIYDTFNNLD